MIQQVAKPLAPTVGVVLCTYNGEKYLEQQIESVLQQDWPVAVHVFDDMSNDSTLEKLQNYQQRGALCVVQNQANLGYVHNFEQGIRSVLDKGFDYIALCDQDDLWEPDRISRGMSELLAQQDLHSQDTPLLVHSDLSMIDSDNASLHISYLDYRGYTIDERRSVPTVLGQNGVMGNTVLMNRALARLALPFPTTLHVHDYWLAVIGELYGRRMLIEGTPVHYRIHISNASNSAASTRFGAARLFSDKSLTRIMRRDFRLPFKEDGRLAALETLLEQPQRFPELPPEDFHHLQVFLDYLRLDASRWRMFLQMKRNGFFKHGVFHHLRIALSMLLTRRY